MQLIEKMVAPDPEDRFDVVDVFATTFGFKKDPTKWRVEKYPNDDFFAALSDEFFASLSGDNFRDIWFLFYDYILNRANDDASSDEKFDDDMFDNLEKNLERLKNYQHDFDFG